MKMKNLLSPNTEPFGAVLEPPAIFKVIPDGFCGICEKAIKPYAETYYQKHYESGTRYCFPYSASAGFCENCAKEAASLEYCSDPLCNIAGRFEKVKDGDHCSVIEFEDGTLLETMSRREMFRRS